jgi:hypothetical protein
VRTFTTEVAILKGKDENGDVIPVIYRRDHVILHAAGGSAVESGEHLTDLSEPFLRTWVMFEGRCVPVRIYEEMERVLRLKGVDTDKRGVEVDLSVCSILTDWIE